MTSPTGKPPLALLIVLAGLGPFAINVAVPMMPAFAAVFGTSYALAQLTLTAYLATVAVSTIAVGVLSDQFGRRPVILVCLGVFVVGALLAAVAPTIEVLIAARVVQAAGGTGGIVLSRTMLYDVYGRERAASLIGYTTMAMVVAPMLAPTVGGIAVTSIGWRAAFVALAVVAGAVLLVSMRALPETADPAKRSMGTFAWGDVGQLVRRRRFWGLVMNQSFASAMFFSFIAAAPYIVVELMMRSPVDYGLWFIFVSLGYMFGNFLSGRFSVRIGPDRMIVAGCLVAFVGLAVLWSLRGWNDPGALFFAMAVIAISNGMTLPNSMANTMALFPSLAGTASGLAGFIQLGVGAIATVIVAGQMTTSADPMIWAMTISGCLSLVGILIVFVIHAAREQTGEKRMAG